MTSEERRNHNAALRAQRAGKRRMEAKVREVKRQAEAKRITALRLQGTLLDEAAKKVKAAVGKAAIKKQRAEAERQKKVKAAAGLAMAKAGMARQSIADRLRELSSEAKGPLVPQAPKEIEGRAGVVVGSIKLQKWQDTLENLGTVGGLIFGAGIIKNNISTTLGLVGDTARFEMTDFADCIGPIDGARDLLTELDAQIIAATNALAEVDLEGIISVFSESRRKK